MVVSNILNTRTVFIFKYTKLLVDCFDFKSCEADLDESLI